MLVDTSYRFKLKGIKLLKIVIVLHLGLMVDPTFPIMQQIRLDGPSLLVNPIIINL